MHRKTVLVSALAVLLGTAAARAAEPPLVTDRPDQTESALVVPTGRVQIEAGWNTSRDEEGGGVFESREVPSTLVRIGVARRFELRLGWDGFVRGKSRVGGSSGVDSGAGDVSIGGKILLADERGRAPQAALIVATSLPIGKDEVSSGRADPGAVVSLSHTLTDRVGLGYNVGARWSSSEDGAGETDTLSAGVYTVAAGIGIAERVGAFVELFGEVPMSAPGGPAHSFDGGFTYLLRDNLQLDVAAGVGISDRSVDRFVTLGVSVRLPR